MIEEAFYKAQRKFNPPSGAATTMPPALAGFEFRQRRDTINWRLLSTVDVDKIVKNVIITSFKNMKKK